MFSHRVHIALFAALAAFMSQGSAQWVRTSLPPGPRVFVLLPTDTNLLAGTTQGVFVSSDDGVHWTKENNGLTDDGVWGLTTIANNSGGADLFAGAFGSAYVSTNDGASWSAIDSGLTQNYILTLTASGSTLFAGTISGGFFSTNEGTRWSAINYGLPEVAINSFATRSADILAGTSSGVYVSTTTGQYWSAKNTGLTNTDVWTVAAESAEVFAGTSNGLFVSTDEGSSWHESDTGISNKFVSALLAYPSGGVGDYLVAGTKNGGVFLSDNNALSWNALDSGLAKAYIWSFAAHDNQLFAGTDSGVWVHPLPQIVTSVPRTPMAVPKGFTLEQNYPNPFNPTTVIGYSIPRRAHIELKVFDLLGRVVGILVDEEKAPGTYAAKFDASQLSSGVYFYRLSSGTFNDAKKFVVVK
jgi:ligand-binding sensor domain-containing protein